MNLASCETWKSNFDRLYFFHLVRKVCSSMLKSDTSIISQEWLTWCFLLIFQNNLLPSGEKSLVAKSLVIESVDRHEAGIYICEAKNGVGHKSATASIKLQVLCKFCRSRFATTRHSGQNIMKSIQKVHIYHGGFTTTPGFYFSKWVFGWGSIYIWPAWGCNQDKVLLICLSRVSAVYFMN